MRWRTQRVSWGIERVNWTAQPGQWEVPRGERQTELTSQATMWTGKCIQRLNWRLRGPEHLDGIRYQP